MHIKGRFGKRQVESCEEYHDLDPDHSDHELLRMVAHFLTEQSD